MFKDMDMHTGSGGPDSFPGEKTGSMHQKP